MSFDLAVRHNEPYLDMAVSLPELARRIVNGKPSEPSLESSDLIEQTRELAAVFNQPDNEFHKLPLILADPEQQNDVRVFESIKDISTYTGQGFVGDGEIRTAGELRADFSNVLNDKILKHITTPQWLELAMSVVGHQLIEEHLGKIGVLGDQARTFMESFIDTVMKARNFAARCIGQAKPHPEKN